MSEIEIVDVHTTISERYIRDPALFTPEKLSDIFSECRHKIRLSSTDARIEAGEIPVESVKQLAEAIRPHRQITGWIAVNPHFLEQGLEAIELAVKTHGMKCVGEMIQYMENWETDEYKVLPFVKLSGDLGVPISFHAGAWSHVEGVIHLAESFPRTNFIMAHFGGRAWNTAWRLLKDSGIRNIWGEINLKEPTNKKILADSQERISAIIDALGIERVVFGTDSCVEDAKYNYGNWLLDTLESMKLSDRDIERICGLNAREVMGLDPL